MIKFKSLIRFETNYKFLFAAILFLGAIFSSSVALTPDQKKLKNALKKGDAEYFQKVTKPELDAANTSSKGSQVQKFGIKSVPAILGGFANPDVEVRKVIYTELLFPEYFKELGEKPIKKMSADPESNNFLNMVREKMFAQDEKDPEAEELLFRVIQTYNFSLREAINKKNAKSVACMSPEFFKESNAEHEKTVIGRFGRRSVKTLVKALNYEKGDPETKALILDALLFKDQGGPEKVIPKMSTRAKRAEELFLIADKMVEKSSKTGSLSEKILKVAEAYISTEFDAE